MADPFQDVDAAGPEFIKAFADSMDTRQSDPTMERIVAAYLGRLSFPAGSLTVEIGAGAGAVTRRIAARAAPAHVIGFEPSAGFVSEARDRATGLDNLSFQQANGAHLPLEDGAAQNVILHTVLTHVTNPEALLAEAARVLAPGGRLVVGDVDFSKASLANAPNDPLDVCAREFARTYVTDAHLVGRLRSLITDTGLTLEHFGLDSRVITGAEQMRPWVEFTARDMVEAGTIGEDMARSLMAEHDRRAEEGTLYGYQAFATAVALKG